MSAVQREQQLAEAFVYLSGTLIQDFDLLDFLHALTDYAVGLLEADAAGVVLADPQGRMVDATASDEATRHLELTQADWDEGPCRDCIRTGAGVSALLTEPAAAQRWPHVVPLARRCGYTVVSGVPMRLRQQVIGALNVFRIRPRTLDRHEQRLAEALANTATVGLLQQHALREPPVLVSQLRTALNSRLLIEQAKGILSEREGITVDQAFVRMRRYARDNRMSLTALADRVIAGELALGLFSEQS